MATYDAAAFKLKENEMDVLSDVLDAIHIKGALYFEVEAAHPWVAVNPSMTSIGSAMLNDVESVIPFHIMIKGVAWAKKENGELQPEMVESGDVVMFPMGSSHILTSDKNNWYGVPLDDEFYKETARKAQPFTFLEIGTGHDCSTFICGYIGFDATPFNPLLNTLPEMLVIKNHFIKDSLMATLLVSTLKEMKSSSAGAKNLVSRLSEVIFTQALRQHMADLAHNVPSNWLSAQKDEYIGKALMLIHRDPIQSWTLESLAKECGLSRSSFAERFHYCVGQPPLQYIGRWRMQLASVALTNGLSITRVAEQVGYSSEAAFNKAFKNYVGIAPGEWRSKHQLRADHHNKFTEDSL